MAENVPGPIGSIGSIAENFTPRASETVENRAGGSSYFSLRIIKLIEAVRRLGSSASG